MGFRCKTSRSGDHLLKVKMTHEFAMAFCVGGTGATTVAITVVSTTRSLYKSMRLAEALPSPLQTAAPLTVGGCCGTKGGLAHTMSIVSQINSTHFQHDSYVLHELVI